MLDLALCRGCRREIWIAPDVPAFCSRCESAEPSGAELAWFALMGDANAYSDDAAGAREAWERANVVWFHGFANGASVWRSERPPPEPARDAPDAEASLATEPVHRGFGGAELLAAIVEGLS